MADLFLPGPFAEADFLGAILGSGAPAALRPARLDGYALRADPHGPQAVLVAEPGSMTAGAVADADPRLACALAAMGGVAAAAVATSAGPAEAWTAPADAAPAAAWPAVPDREWRAHLVEALAEAMALAQGRDGAALRALMPGIGYRALARTRGRAEPGPHALRRDLSLAHDVETIAVARPYARYFAVEEHRLRHRRFDGRMSPVIDRAVFTSGDAVTVLPFDPRLGLVLMIEQFRSGPLARLDPRPWCLEAVAGRCDPGEGPETTARREAVEEAGLTLGRLERIAAYYTSPGTMAEHITAFVGEASLEGVSGVHGLDAEDEDIRAHVLPLVEAMRLVATGEVNNAPLLVSLLWLDAHAGRLAAVWSR